MFQQLETFLQIIDPNFCNTTYFVKKKLNHRKCTCITNVIGKAHISPLA